MMTTMLSEGGKAVAKVGSKVICYVGGSLLGFGLSQAVLPTMRKSMDKYMASDEFKKLSPEKQQAEINWYNIEATAVNGLCAAAGSLVASVTDGVVNSTIEKSNVSTGFTIGTDFRI